jgi:CDP-diacylglycerol--glycerol-3-phosphate 3-phosphatidyltransferase
MSRRFHFVTFLTFVRVPLVLFFAAGAIVHSMCGDGSRWVFFASLAFLVAAALSDMFDGFFARKLKATSTLGAYADPFTDKVFYLTSLPLLVFLAASNDHTVHAILLLCLTILFLLRDQWVSFLRSIGSLHAADASANWSGKLRTTICFPLICLVYFCEESGYRLLPYGVLYGLEALAMAVNLISIWVYSARYWRYLRKSAAARVDPPE